MRNLVLLLGLLALVTVAQASVIVDAYYTWSGVVGNPAAASVGGLTGTGTITLVNGPAGAPAVSFSGGAYYSGSLVSTAIDNFGIDAWVMATDTTYGGIVASNGDDQSSGWGLATEGPFWVGSYGGLAAYEIGTVTPGQWVQIAMVRSGGATSYYLNGTLGGLCCPTISPIAPSGPMMIGNGELIAGLYWAPFRGDIAAVRIFEFAPGGFNPDTDLNDMPSVPEPATFGLAGLSAVSLLLLRRRRGINYA
jgi:hypothetical protein